MNDTGPQYLRLFLKHSWTVELENAQKTNSVTFLFIPGNANTFIVQFKSLAEEAQYPLDAPPTITMFAAKLPNKMVVTIRLIHPSHGGAYMVEGCSTIRFGLACRCTRALHLHTLPHIVTVHRTFLFSCVSGFRVAPILLLCYLRYHVFHSAAYMVSCIP